MGAQGATLFRPLIVYYNVSQGSFSPCRVNCTIVQTHDWLPQPLRVRGGGLLRLGSPGTRWEAVNGLSLTENIHWVSVH